MFNPLSFSSSKTKCCEYCIFGLFWKFFFVYFGRMKNRSKIWIHRRDIFAISLEDGRCARSCFLTACRGSHRCEGSLPVVAQVSPGDAPFSRAANLEQWKRATKARNLFTGFPLFLSPSDIWHTASPNTLLLQHYPLQRVNGCTCHRLRHCKQS